MTARPAEVIEVHSRLLKCALEVEDCRAYWKHAGTGDDETPRAQRAFEEYWFGAKSLERIKVLILNFHLRFDAYPAALSVLSRWPDMDPVARKVICHWHLQLADPLYRRFTGEYLVQRREAARAEVTRDLVASWVKQNAPERWRTNTQIHFASKLLSAAYSAGLVASNRDPRPLCFPSVGDAALTYFLYLLRGIDFSGTLTRNPYLASVGLEDAVLEDRLRGLDTLGFRRQGDLTDFTWRHPDIGTYSDKWDAFRIVVFRNYVSHRGNHPFHFEVGGSGPRNRLIVDLRDKNSGSSNRDAFDELARFFEIVKRSCDGVLSAL